MKNIIFINGYNNYYNRRVKYSQNLNDYINNYDCFIKENINFNPNDGVKASLTANLDIDINTDSPDYALLLDENSNILSRWFVIDLIRNRNGQYNVQLKRDVIADHFDELRGLPVFVHKGNLDVNNNLIYNKEGIAVNQIKTSQTLLKDETQKKWIVGYFEQDKVDIEEVSSAPTNNTNAIDLDSLGIKLVDSADPSQGGEFYYASSGIGIGAVGAFYESWITGWQHALFCSFYDSSLRNVIDRNGVQGAGINSNNKAFSYNGNKGIGIDAWSAAVEANYDSIIRTKLIQYLAARDKLPQEDINNIISKNGQRVYSNISQEYYILHVDESYTYDVEYLTLEDGDALTTSLNYVLTEMLADNPSFSRDFVGNPFQLMCRWRVYKVRFSIAPSPEVVSVTIPNSRQHLIDAPYDMFVLPFGENEDINLNLATQIGIKLGKSCYDIQILPYCPLRDLMTSEGVDITLGRAEINYTPITRQLDEETEETVGYLYFASASSGQFIINYNIPAPLNALDMKIANECDMYRLCSPNYNGAYEFSAAKNRGVDYFIVSYTYKPYSPYIQVSPSFKGLYGRDFTDGRGLICNGDFSIAMISEAWVSYQNNNKNYENIFNAQIKTMDANNQLNLVSQGITSTLGAAATGVTVGALGGGVAGGIAAGVGSLAGGAADLAIGQSIYQNNRQLQKDLYNYNLQNIQARPDTLNKISAYNINNNYFPFIEYYTATEEEKQALRNKIKYEGMTVMTIGRIQDYLGAVENFNYFKGQLIQTGDISEDYHIIDAIAVELERGIYLPGGNN